MSDFEELWKRDPEYARALMSAAGREGRLGEFVGERPADDNLAFFVALRECITAELGNGFEYAVACSTERFRVHTRRGFIFHYALNQNPKEVQLFSVQWPDRRSLGWAGVSKGRSRFVSNNAAAAMVYPSRPWINSRLQPANLSHICDAMARMCSSKLIKGIHFRNLQHRRLPIPKGERDCNIWTRDELLEAAGMKEVMTPIGVAMHDMPQIGVSEGDTLYTTDIKSEGNMPTGLCGDCAETFGVRPNTPVQCPNCGCMHNLKISAGVKS